MKRILFLTGTRADFGKMKPLIQAVEDDDDFACTVFVTGMHTLDLHGMTVNEVHKAGFSEVHVFMNQFVGEPMDLVLANTIGGLSRFVHEAEPDLMVVHGDRVEALAGAIVGALRGIRVGHVEGGELSGTVDELIRHAVSKLSHVHFVANEDAARRLRQLGELPDSIFVIGSPDIDVMASDRLPSLTAVRERYAIPFEEYGVALLHSVTTELEALRGHANAFVDALVRSERNYVLIHPNNDEGTNLIHEAYERVRGNPRIRVYPSLRFEFFLALLKHADFVVGNSSAGIREAPFYGVPSVNIGTRQSNRFTHDSILDVTYDAGAILAAIERAAAMERFPSSTYFGEGDSHRRFLEVIRGGEAWRIPKQKQFVDILPVLEQAG